MELIYRIKYTHEVEGTLVANLPEGWEGIELGVERDEQFSSVLPYFKSSAFSAFGTNGTINGARDFLKSIAETHGPDEQIEVIWDISDNGGLSWYNFFTGLIAVGSYKELLTDEPPSHVIQFGTTLRNVWTKFVKRLDTPVNLKSTTDKDGNSITATENIDLVLPTQKVRYSINAVANESWILTLLGVNQLEPFVFTPGVDTIEAEEIEINSASSAYQTVEEVPPLFIAPWDGEYRIQRKFSTSEWSGSVWKVPDGGDPLNFYLQKNTETALAFSKSTLSDALTFSTDTTLNLRRGDRVKIYSSNAEDIGRINTLGEIPWVRKAACVARAIGNITLSGLGTADGVSLSAGNLVLAPEQVDPTENGVWVVANGSWSRYSGLNSPSEFDLAAVRVTGGDVYSNTSWKQTAEITVLGSDPIVWEQLTSSDEVIFQAYTGPASRDNYLIVTADTTYKETTIEGYLIHDLLYGIVQRITGHTFYSELLGSTKTKMRAYAQDGCYWNHAIAPGLQVRGYTFSEKQLNHSAKNCWEGLNPLFNLGLSFEKVGNEYVIRCEEKSHFFDSSSYSLRLSNINRVEKEFDKDFQFNVVESGFSKGKSEEINGLDDIQAKSTWTTRFKYLGKKISLLTNYIAASITWEVARRTEITKDSDYKYDDDIFIVNVQESSGEFTASLNENIASTNNLINEEYRYNKELSPARMLVRWLNYLSCSLQDYITSLFSFSGGTGNYDASIETISTSCPGDFNGDPLSEKANHSISSTPLFRAELLTIPEHPMSLTQFFTMLNNNKLALEISQTTSNYTRFIIKNFRYRPNDGIATIQGWPVTKFSIQQVSSTPAQPVTEVNGIFDDSFDSTFE